MTTAITDKTQVVVTRLGDYWITPAQALVIIQTLEISPNSHIDFDGTIIRCSAIDGVMKPEDYQTYNLKRSGGWQCKYQKWHDRNQQCAHNQTMR